MRSYTKHKKYIEGRPASAAVAKSIPSSSSRPRARLTSPSTSYAAAVPVSAESKSASSAPSQYDSSSWASSSDIDKAILAQFNINSESETMRELLSLPLTDPSSIPSRFDIRSRPLTSLDLTSNSSSSSSSSTGHLPRLFSTVGKWGFNSSSNWKNELKLSLDANYQSPMALIKIMDSLRLHRVKFTEVIDNNNRVFVHPMSIVLPAGDSIPAEHRSLRPLTMLERNKEMSPAGRIRKAALLLHIILASPLISESAWPTSCPTDVIPSSITSARFGNKSVTIHFNEVDFATSLLTQIRSGFFSLLAPRQEPIPVIGVSIGAASSLRRALRCESPAIQIHQVYTIARFAMQLPFWMVRPHPSPSSASPGHNSNTTSSSSSSNSNSNSGLGPGSNSMTGPGLDPSSNPNPRLGRFRLEQSQKEAALIVLVPYYEIPAIQQFCATHRLTLNSIVQSDVCNNCWTENKHGPGICPSVRYQEPSIVSSSADPVSASCPLCGSVAHRPWRCPTHPLYIIKSIFIKTDSDQSSASSDNVNPNAKSARPSPSPPSPGPSPTPSVSPPAPSSSSPNNGSLSLVPPQAPTASSPLDLAMVQQLIATALAAQKQQHDQEIAGLKAQIASRPLGPITGSNVQKRSNPNDGAGPNQSATKSKTTTSSSPSSSSTSSSSSSSSVGPTQTNAAVRPMLPHPPPRQRLTLPQLPSSLSSSSSPAGPIQIGNTYAPLSESDMDSDSPSNSNATGTGPAGPFTLVPPRRKGPGPNNQPHNDNG